MVVEEGPAKTKAKQPSKLAQSNVLNNVIDKPQSSPDSVEESMEEDEVSEEEEDDKFDINDSSPEAAAPKLENRQTQEEEALGMAKAREQAGTDPLATPEAAAIALHDGNAYMRSAKSKAKSRSRDRSRRRSNSHSGVDTPGRFAGPTPHPPHTSPRHVGFADLAPLSPSESSASLPQVHPAQHGTRDDINTLRSGHASGKSRIPRDRDLDVENLNLKTPTAADAMHGGRKGHLRGHSPEHEHHHHHRAFAVWGQDESDSNASDSDA